MPRPQQHLLVGTVDLTRTLRSCYGQCAKRWSFETACVNAPDNLFHDVAKHGIARTEGNLALSLNPRQSPESRRALSCERSHRPGGTRRQRLETGCALSARPTDHGAP